MAIEKIKILGGRFGATNQTTHSPKKLAKLAELAVLFSW